MKMLTKIYKKLGQQGLALNELIRINGNIDVNTATKPDDVPEFPLNTLEEFDKFETNLIQQEIHKYMVGKFCFSIIPLCIGIKNLHMF